MLRRIFYLTLVISCCMACAKQQLKNGEKSLEGDWKVNSIFSSIQIIDADGTLISSEELETGDLGFFRFSENQLDYNFTMQDSLFENSNDWELERDTRPAGFFKEEIYTLRLDDFTFNCEFGDQTSDAEKKATEVRLIFKGLQIGDADYFELSLEKD